MPDGHTPTHDALQMALTPALRFRTCDDVAPVAASASHAKLCEQLASNVTPKSTQASRCSAGMR